MEVGRRARPARIDARGEESERRPHAPTEPSARQDLEGLQWKIHEAPVPEDPTRRVHLEEIRTEKFHDGASRLGISIVEPVGAGIIQELACPEGACVAPGLRRRL